MRTYSSFLLFEDVLDYLDSSNTTIYNFCVNVIRPIVKVTADDCGTKIGKLIDVNFEIEGLIELSTGLTLSQSRITTLLTNGQYKVATRDLYTCVATNGICRSCYKGTYIDQSVPNLNDTIRLEPDYNFQTDIILGDGIKSVFTLSEDSTQYTKLLLLIGGVIQTTGYTVSGSTITFSSPPSNGVNAVAKFYKTTAQPFLGYLAQTYAGSVLGMKPLPTQMIHIRPSLLQNSFTANDFLYVEEEIKRVYHNKIDQSYFDYMAKIVDPLERALYIAMLHGLLANVRN